MENMSFELVLVGVLSPIMTYVIYLIKIRGIRLEKANLSNMDRITVIEKQLVALESNLEFSQRLGRTEILSVKEDIREMKTDVKDLIKLMTERK